MANVDRSEITPEQAYLSRRAFMRRFGIAMAGVTAGSTIFAACARPEDEGPSMGGGQVATAVPAETSTPAEPEAPAETNTPAAVNKPTSTSAPTSTPRPTVAVEWPALSAEADELGDALTEDKFVQRYNNFYEFSFDKSDVAELARYLVTDPWTVQVGGMVERPKTFDLQELLAFQQEERIYRMRCVEGWSMVIPWIGFPLSKLLEVVSPKPEAQYVRFVTLYDPEQMPNQARGGFPFPYIEGLRLDEAMHDLTIMATGLYGKALTPQTGAPIRLVVPWKYGFKSIKSVVQIDLVDEMPSSTWMTLAPHEYGFYANVNPEVHHPRWTQATERRVGEDGRRRTLLHNGYEDEVAHLYADLDLKKWY